MYVKKVEYFSAQHPPMLSLVIHNAPHYRMHRAVLQSYREDIMRACGKAGIVTPIDDPIDLSVLFVNPSTPDLGNAYLALERAMDGKALSGPSLLTDDSLVSKLTISKYFSARPKK